MDEGAPPLSSPRPPPGYMYIRILLDHVTSTQPISVSVLVGEAGA